MPGSPKRTRPDCPYSASQLELINLQNDQIALGLGILCEDEIVNFTPKQLSETLELYRRFVQDKNLRDHLNEADEADLDSLVRSYYEDGPIS